MQPRHAAVALLRRIALQDFVKAPVYRKRWVYPRVRLFHHSSRYFLSPESSAKSTSYNPAGKQAYDITFTCKPCSTRATHRISKQAYHYGSVLITCPECRNRHIISDHL